MRAKELEELSAGITGSAVRVVTLLWQEMHDPFLLNPRVLGPRRLSWTEDGHAWHELTGGRIHGALSITPQLTLDGDEHARLQSLLDEGETALLATHYLYGAHRASGARQTWIEATIAAELAIKEVLARMKPDIRVLLFQLPSPPIHKLYGLILEDVAGERSPYVRDLQSGAERRNQLVHRPEEAAISAQEVAQYLSDVDGAILHLLNLERKIRRQHPPIG